MTPYHKANRTLPRRGVLIAAVLLLALSAAAPVRAAQPAEGEPPMSAAVEALLRGPGCHVRIDGSLESGGAVISELHASGVYRGAVAYRFEATARLAGATTEFRVVRLGDRLWLWSGAQGGWRSVRTGSEPVIGSVEDILRALPALESTGPPQSTDFRGEACRAYGFRVPPGAATVQAMPVEGAGTLYVSPDTGRPVGLDLTIRTPADATGHVTAVFSSYGEDVDVQAPGLGMEPDAAAPPALTAASLLERLAAQTAVRVDTHLQGTGLGGGQAGRGLPAELTLMAMPQRKFALVEFVAGGTRTDELVALDDVVFFHTPGTAETGPVWRSGDQRRDRPAAWTGAAEAIRQALGDRTLEQPAPALLDGRCVWSYAFDPLSPTPSGLLLPPTLEAFRDQEREAYARILVSRDTGLPARVELGVTIYPSERDTVTVRESYDFAYGFEPAQQARLDRLFTWAEAERARRAAIAGRAEEIARRLADDARQGIEDADFMKRRVHRAMARGETGCVRVLSATWQVVASEALPDAPDPATFPPQQPDPDDGIVRTWFRGVFQCVVPVRRGAATVGFAVVESLRFVPTAPVGDEESGRSAGK
jgi:hypothetical protein